jgi:hypothetical protein
VYFILRAVKIFLKRTWLGFLCGLRYVFSKSHYRLITYRSQCAGGEGRPTYYTAD